MAKTRPFAPLIPNEETVAAMKAVRRGELVTVGSSDKLLPSPSADDKKDRSSPRKRGPSAENC
jgi:hypothetical protein